MHLYLALGSEVRKATKATGGVRVEWAVGGWGKEGCPTSSVPRVNPHDRSDDAKKSDFRTI